jgi:hypothetical protein
MGTEIGQLSEHRTRILVDFLSTGIRLPAGDIGCWDHSVDVWVKQLGREVDHLPQSGKVKKVKTSSGKN